MNARTGGDIMASGSTNKSTGSGTRTKGASAGNGQARTRTTTTQKRKKQQMNDQIFDDVIMIVSGAVCIFLFLDCLRILRRFL